MTELKLENLVLDGVRVAALANATGLVRLASQEAGQRLPTVVPSPKRHLLSIAAEPEVDSRPRYQPASDGGNSASRAGRLAVIAGASRSRIPPLSAGPSRLNAGRKAMALAHLLCLGRSKRWATGQPSVTTTFTRLTATSRPCPAWQGRQARMSRLTPAGTKPGAGR
jgi:hypothetical protein